MISLLSRAAKLLQRSPRDAQFLGSRQSVAWKLVATGVITFPIIVFVLPLLMQEAREWGSTKVAIPIPPEDWRVLYRDLQSAEACDRESPSKECLVKNPDSALWKSENRRGTRKHFDRVQQMQGKVFWIGARIEPNTLVQAKATEANQLLLGYVSGAYELWIDGEMLAMGDHSGTRFPIRVQLPFARLKADKSLLIAIKIHHASGRVMPDFLGGHIATGFSNFQAAEKLESQMMFLAQSRPWLFFGLYLFVGAAFLFFWWASKKKQEYWYVGAFGLIQASLSALGIDLVHRSLSAEQFYSSEAILRWYEGSFALFLGLAFARSRRPIFSLGLPVMLVLPWILLATLNLPNFKMLHTDFYRYGLSLCYGVGSLSCLLQAAALWGQNFQGASRARFIRLFCFGLGLAFLGLTYFKFVAAAYEFSVWYRFANLGVVAFLAGIVLSEYREQEKIIEKAPVSPYHRRPALPERITGAIALLDIKGSEDLFRLGSARGEAGSHMHACLSFLWTAMTDAGGTVLQTEGDQLKVFFEDKSGNKAECLKNALNSFFKAQEALDRFSKQEEAWGFEKRLFFRGAISFGDIRPVWQDSADGRFPSWIEAGSENVLVDVTRYMEMERSLNDLPESSMVVMAEGTADLLSEGFPASHWKLRNQAHIGKHQKIYRVATFAVAEHTANTTIRAA